MATRKSLIVNIFVVLVASFLAASCKDSSMYNIDELGPDTTTVVRQDTVVQRDTIKVYEPQFVDIVEGDTILRDGKGEPMPNEKWRKVVITLKASPREAKVQAEEPWHLREQSNTKVPSYAFGGGETQWAYNHNTVSVIDSVYAISTDGRFLPLYKPERLRETQSTESVTDIEGGRGTKSEVIYALSLEGSVLLTTPQTLLTDIEEVPVTVVGYKVVSTHHDKWNSVTGSYELTCNNHVTVVEVMSDGSEGKTYDLPYISYNYWVASGKIVAEVEDLNAVIGVPVAISSDGSVTIAGSSMTFSHSMKADKVSKGTWSYQPDACEAVAKTLTPISATQGRVDLYHGTSKVGDFIVPITLTEKQKPTVVGYRVVSTHHKNWNTVTGSFQLTCDNYVTVVEVKSDGSEGQTFNLDYLSYNYWTAVGKIVAEVEDLNAVIGVPVAISSDGSVTIAGSSMTFSHSMKADKVSKGTWSYQPDACEAVAKYLTPISATQGRVDVYHGTAKVGSFIVPISLTEKKTEKVPGKIVAGWATDSYESSTNFHYNWHSSTFHIVVLKDGAYTVYSRDVNATNGWKTTSITSTLATNGMPLAYVGDNGEAEIGYIEKNVSQGSWCKIVYRKADGSLDKALSETEKAFHKDDDMFQRNPLRGQWSNGKISADGHTLYVTGTED